MASSHNTHRRALLKGLPVVPLAIVGPAMAQVSSTCFSVSPEIWSGFQAWMDARHRVNAYGYSKYATEEMFERLVDGLTRRERRVLALPSKSPGDVLVKVLLESAFGGFEVSQGLFDEAVSMLGLGDDPRAQA